ncbi:toxin-antitoxin system HicB family antitoxin [Mycobacterium palustre]|nr:toxin-antitoxin system HicB family antitoxin [Mycobacterium palustre]
MVRTSWELHARLAMESIEQGVSMTGAPRTASSASRASTR